MGKQLFSKRKFLNKKGYHSNAAVTATIERNSYGSKGYYGTFKVSDCNRTVELSIDLEDLKEYENTLYKINQIIEVAENFKRAIVEIKPKIEDLVKKEKIRKAKEKAKKKAKKKADKLAAKASTEEKK